MSAADERAKVLKAVRVDFDKALILAENVSALVSLSITCSGRSIRSRRKVIPVANKALKAASLGADAYKRVALEKILRLSLELISTGAAIYFSP